jgi:hypothetical protein
MPFVLLIDCCCDRLLFRKDIVKIQNVEGRTAVEALFRQEAREPQNESWPPSLADSQTIAQTLSRPPLCCASVQEAIEGMLLDWARILFVKLTPVQQVGIDSRYCIGQQSMCHQVLKAHTRTPQFAPPPNESNVPPTSEEPASNNGSVSHQSIAPTETAEVADSVYAIPKHRPSNGDVPVDSSVRVEPHRDESDAATSFVDMPRPGHAIADSDSLHTGDCMEDPPSCDPASAEVDPNTNHEDNDVQSAARPSCMGLSCLANAAATLVDLVDNDADNNISVVEVDDRCIPEINCPMDDHEIDQFLEGFKSPEDFVFSLLLTSTSISQKLKRLPAVFRKRAAPP